MAQRTPERRTGTPPIPDETSGGVSAPAVSDSAEVAAFLEEAAGAPREGQGRLVVILDATMSRQPTWDAAMAIQSEMFEAAAKRGGLAVELVYFRGFRECRSSGWVADARALARKMTAVSCQAGATQIGRALAHVLKRAESGRVDAFVYVGDAFEEGIDRVGDAAGRLGLRGVRGFVFHEGRDPAAAQAFREIARLTGGSYHVFDVRSPEVLKGLLGAAAAYAAGGYMALQDYGRTGGAAGEVARALPPPGGSGRG